MGTAAEHWYYPGRDHTFFAIETDIHHGDLSAFALPARPPGLRERLTGTGDLVLERVALLPETLDQAEQEVIADRRSDGWRIEAGDANPIVASTSSA